jgi:hypothetical protein
MLVDFRTRTAMRASELNAVYSRASMRRRYEVWFLRFALADGSGAWWLRYLVFNPGRAGCAGHPRGAPAQLWATWFPRGGAPQSFLQGFPLEALRLSPRGTSPFRVQIAENFIEEKACRGRMEADGHRVEWDLQWRSHFGASLTEVGWIGFSRTPHSDAKFSGHIALDARAVEGDPLGFGLEGHNCGFRHRRFWTWAHCHFRSADGAPSTFEAVIYELPLGLRFRSALLWHRGRVREFRELEEMGRDPDRLIWSLHGYDPNDGTTLVALLDGRGPSRLRLPYLKTDCSGTFEVANNSLARATLCVSRPGEPCETFCTDSGAAIEMAGG